MGSHEVQEVASKVEQALIGPDRSQARQEADTLLDKWDANSVRADRAMLTRQLEESGILQQLLITEAPNFDENADGGISSGELYNVANADELSVTDIAATHAYGRFDRIDSDEDGELSNDELIEYGAEAKLRAPTSLSGDELDPSTFSRELTLSDGTTVEVVPGTDTSSEEIRDSERTNEEDYQHILENPNASETDKLQAVRALAELGRTEITLTDTDGTVVSCRIEVSPVDSDRNYVQLFAQDVGGRSERILLRGIEEDGAISQQYKEDGSLASFTGDWWSTNHPDSALSG